MKEGRGMDSWLFFCHCISYEEPEMTSSIYLHPASNSPPRMLSTPSLALPYQPLPSPSKSLRTHTPFFYLTPYRV